MFNPTHRGRTQFPPIIEYRAEIDVFSVRAIPEDELDGAIESQAGPDSYQIFGDRPKLSMRIPKKQLEFTIPPLVLHLHLCKVLQSVYISLCRYISS